MPIGINLISFQRLVDRQDLLTLVRSWFEAEWPDGHGLAAELSEQDVDDLAEHYAALLPPRTAESPGSDAGGAVADRLRCAGCHGPALQGTTIGAPRLAGQKARYTAWSLQQMRGGTRSHGTATKPDPLLANLSNVEIESLAAHFASLR